MTFAPQDKLPAFTPVVMQAEFPASVSAGSSLQPAPPVCVQPRPNLYEDPEFRRVAGSALRPGGLTLTTRGLDACDLRAGALVVDIGCGTGASAALARSQDLRAVGVDASETLLREAGRGHPGLPLVRGTAERLPLRNGVCDAVLCECVLSLSGKPDQAVAEFRRILKPGGYLLLTDIYLRHDARGFASRGAESGCCQPLTDLNRPHFENASPFGGNASPMAEHLPHTGMKSCIEGAESRDAVTARLKRLGFDVLLFEDHSRLLADLTARLVFAGLSPGRFFSGAQRANTTESTESPVLPRMRHSAQACACGGVAASRARLGYYLLVASGINR